VFGQYHGGLILNAMPFVTLGALSSMIAWRSNLMRHVALRVAYTLLAPVFTSTIMLECKNQQLFMDSSIRQRMNFVFSAALKDVSNKGAEAWDLVDCQYRALGKCINKPR